MEPKTVNLEANSLNDELDKLAREMLDGDVNDEEILSRSRRNLSNK